MKDHQDPTESPERPENAVYGPLPRLYEAIADTLRGDLRATARILTNPDRYPENLRDIEARRLPVLLASLNACRQLHNDAVAAAPATTTDNYCADLTTKARDLVAAAQALGADYFHGAYEPLAQRIEDLADTLDVPAVNQ